MGMVGILYLRFTQRESKDILVARLKRGRTSL